MALRCSIELNKTSGITVKVEDEDAKLSQTIVIDGAKITTTAKSEDSTSTVTQDATKICLEVKGSEDTSTITQIAGSITIKVKAFSLEAETIDVKSTADTTVKSEAKMTVTTTDDCSVTSSAKLALKSTADMTLASDANLSASAANKAELKGLMVDIDGSQQTKINGGQSVQMTGLSIDIAADTTLSAAGKVTTDLGQQITTVKGKIVNISGNLVNLG
jgi:hypothetical protein